MPLHGGPSQLWSIRWPVEVTSLLGGSQGQTFEDRTIHGVSGSLRLRTAAENRSVSELAKRDYVRHAAPPSHRARAAASPGCERESGLSRGGFAVGERRIARAAGLYVFTYLDHTYMTALCGRPRVSRARGCAGVLSGPEVVSGEDVWSHERTACGCNTARWVTEKDCSARGLVELHLR